MRTATSSLDYNCASLQTEGDSGFEGIKQFGGIHLITMGLQLSSDLVPPESLLILNMSDLEAEEMLLA